MKRIAILAAAAALGVGSTTAGASVVFTFTEVGADVVMTSSGTLDTTKMILFGSDGWGGTGIETNSAGETDIMGGTSFGANDITFTFNAGTDQSAWLNPGGPFSVSTGNFFSDWAINSGSKSFATYGFIAGFRNAGMSMRAADIVGGLWTPDQAWTNANDTFASLGMNVGTYTVADAVTGESITIQIGSAAGVPEPASLALLLAGLGGILARRRGKNA